MTQKFRFSPKSRRGDGLYTKVLGTGPRTLVFIAGLGGTTRYWETRIGPLSCYYRIVLVDLLGFGDSPKPWAKYDVVRHVDALDSALAKFGPITIVGHSLGALLAIAYAARHPERIDNIVLISLPYFGSQDAAYEYMRAGPVKGGFVYTNFVLTMLACIISRRVLGKALPYVIRDMPRDVIEDLVKHTWRSSTSSLWEVVYRYDAAADLQAMVRATKVLCIHGGGDLMAPVRSVQDLAARFPNLDLRILDNVDHHPFIREPEKCCDLIAHFVEGTSRAASAEQR
ncbi:alpha/beta fold hydrolase [Aurantiacibacter atlanticus]|uniref:alpha/beta fold hydrolase n=1 Tax=Aurantiacibacter atlanticus TaxID=1648404 RepID=UPI00066262DB|nr:alpha/beta hydrolase [Aurantiacibacter atlanticus]